MRGRRRRATAPAGLVLPWLAMAFAAVAVPWTLFFSAGIGSLAEALAPAALWAALWPVLLGAALAVLLRRWGDRLPRVPEGDVVVIALRAARAGPAWGEPLARAETCLQRWPVAGVALLALMVILGAILLAGLGADGNSVSPPGLIELSPRAPARGRREAT